MDLQEKIKLGEFRSVNSVNVENNIKLQTKYVNKLLLEYDVNSTIDVSAVFDFERQTTDIYRLHGEIEYLSTINNIPTDYTELSDFFSIPELNVNKKNIITDFNFYIVKPIPPNGYILDDNINTSSGYTQFGSTNRYRRDYQVVTTLSDFDMLNAGFARNIFNEQQYSFIVNKEIDTTNDVDGLGFPLDELFIYAEYKTASNGNARGEFLERKRYDSSGNNNGFENFSNSFYNVGDIIKGDVISYNRNRFLREDYNLMEYIIRIPYGATNFLEFIYNPFIPIRIQQFSNDLDRVNTGSTSYDDVANVPFYATPIDNNGNVVWRDILPKGFTDPISGDGVSFPFINKRHYVFNSIVLDVKPNLNDANTANVFSEISFSSNQIISSEPSSDSDLDNIGKKC